MGFKMFTISAEEHRERSLKLLQGGKHGIDSKEKLNELFFLYNDILTPRKQDRYCGKCKVAVWNSLSRYYGY